MSRDNEKPLDLARRRAPEQLVSPTHAETVLFPTGKHRHIDLKAKRDKLPDDWGDFREKMPTASFVRQEMTGNIILTLPWPPSVNHYYGRRPSGGVYIKPEGKAWRNDVVSSCRVARVKPIVGPICMAVAFYPPDKRRRDEDNLLKALQDAMQVGGCYEDDWYIERRILDRVHEYLGKVVVRLSSLDAAKKAVEDLSK